MATRNWTGLPSCAGSENEMQVARVEPKHDYPPSLVEDAVLAARPRAGEPPLIERGACRHIAVRRVVN